MFKNKSPIYNKSNLGGPNNKIITFNDRAKQEYHDDFYDDFSVEDLAFIDAAEKKETNNKLEIISPPTDAAAVTKNEINHQDHSSSAIRHENSQQKLRDMKNSNGITNDTNLQNSSTQKRSSDEFKILKKQCLEKQTLEFPEKKDELTNDDPLEESSSGKKSNVSNPLPSTSKIPALVGNNIQKRKFPGPAGLLPKTLMVCKVH